MTEEELRIDVEMTELARRWRLAGVDSMADYTEHVQQEFRAMRTRRTA